MRDEMQEAGFGVDYIPTEPGSLEEDRHSAESMGAWIWYAACCGILAFVFGAALGWW